MFEEQSERATCVYVGAVVARKEEFVPIVELVRRGVFLGGRDADEAEFRVFEVRVEGDVGASEAGGKGGPVAIFGTEFDGSEKPADGELQSAREVYDGGVVPGDSVVPLPEEVGRNGEALAALHWEDVREGLQARG